MKIKSTNSLPDSILEKVSGGYLPEQDVEGYLYTAANLKASGDSLDTALEIIHGFHQFSHYTPEEIAYLDNLIISSWDSF